MKKRSTKGFSITTLLITIVVGSIFGVFVWFAFDPLDSYKAKMDVKRKADLKEIQRFLTIYYKDNGRYPPNAGEKDYRMQDYNKNPVDYGKNFYPYKIVIPKDPSIKKRYIYFVSQSGASYWVYASLERGKKDKDVCNKGSVCKSILQNNIMPTICGGVCNYGVSSKNVSL